MGALNRPLVHASSRSLRHARKTYCMYRTCDANEPSLRIRDESQPSSIDVEDSESEHKEQTGEDSWILVHARAMTRAASSSRRVVSSNASSKAPRPSSRAVGAPAADPSPSTTEHGVCSQACNCHWRDTTRSDSHAEVSCRATHRSPIATSCTPALIPNERAPERARARCHSTCAESDSSSRSPITPKRGWYHNDLLRQSHSGRKSSSLPFPRRYPASACATTGAEAANDPPASLSAVHAFAALQMSLRLRECMRAEERPLRTRLILLTPFRVSTSPSDPTGPPEPSGCSAEPHGDRVGVPAAKCPLPVEGAPGTHAAPSPPLCSCPPCSSPSTPDRGTFGTPAAPLSLAGEGPRGGPPTEREAARKGRTAPPRAYSSSSTSSLSSLALGQSAA